MENLKPGLTYTAETVVSEDNSALKLGSGQFAVFATPMMVALMENASLNVVAPYLEAGADTVGTAVNIVHSKATPLGDKVKATAVLTGVEGRKLTFDVVAEDSNGEIGKGTHERFIINVEKFMSKLK
ncbi:MAG: thioesterase family protein [Rikenellaceae bacterium]|nr:thioesterase family protein [Rikenellaceae bacterium]